MWILKKKYDYWWKKYDLKRLTGQLKLHFLTEIGRLHWNQGEEVAHFAWFGEPCFRDFIYTVKKTFQCLNGAAMFNQICALRLVLTVKTLEHKWVSGNRNTWCLDNLKLQFGFFIFQNKMIGPFNYIFTQYEPIINNTYSVASNILLGWRGGSYIFSSIIISLQLA